MNEGVYTANAVSDGGGVGCLATLCKGLAREDVFYGGVGVFIGNTRAGKLTVGDGNTVLQFGNDDTELFSPCTAE
ncbi:MAG: hypothetical protein IKV43_03155, partial [Clostridia bacterium]|nr:hypothetical protein [Clostridia bacterium]